MRTDGARAGAVDRPSIADGASEVVVDGSLRGKGIGVSSGVVKCDTLMSALSKRISMMLWVKSEKLALFGSLIELCWSRSVFTCEFSDDAVSSEAARSMGSLVEME